MPKSKSQNDRIASYSLWRDDDDYSVNWNESSNKIKRFIDAVGYPYKKASSYISDQKVRIVSAKVIPDVTIENRMPGKIIFIKSGSPVVVCGEGLLLIEKLENEKGESILPLTRFRLRFK